LSELEKEEETMSQSRKTKKQSCRINRREFCKTAPCAAIGALSLFSLRGIALSKGSAWPSSKEQHFKKEEDVANKVKSVEAKVISKKGTCALGHKIGDVVKFTETGVEGKICIHALYSMLPAVFAIMYEAQFPWLENPDKKTHACPDAKNPVVFEISRIREK
jgi:uncharacterized repeat protein (TIGR04076 family)